MAGVLKLELLAIYLNIVRLRSIDSERLQVCVMKDCRLDMVYHGIDISFPHNMHLFSQDKSKNAK